MGGLRIFSRVAAAAATLFFSTGAAIPHQSVSALSMRTGAVTSQPIGHYEFCRQYRSECSIKSETSLPPRVTERGWEVIREVNATVNATIQPLTDEDLYGREEVWAYPREAGDCEDYALLKRMKLLEKGFSTADLLLTVLRKPNGEGHAVLTVRTAEGDFVLDNLESDVKLWSETPYEFLKRQASFDTGKWVTIANGAETLVGSVTP